MFKRHFQRGLCCNKVKHARITITHFCFIALTFAGSLERCLNTRPSGLVFRQLPRDPSNVNAWKNMCDPYIHNIIQIYILQYIHDGAQKKNQTSYTNLFPFEETDAQFWFIIIRWRRWRHSWGPHKILRWWDSVAYKENCGWLTVLRTNVYEDVEILSLKPKWYYSIQKTPVKEWEKNTYVRRMVKNSSIILAFTLYEQLSFKEHVKKTEKSK